MQVFNLLSVYPAQVAYYSMYCCTIFSPCMVGCVLVRFVVLCSFVGIRAGLTFSNGRVRKMVKTEKFSTSHLRSSVLLIQWGLPSHNRV